MSEKIIGACIREYIGGDCYGYKIHCDNCHEEVTGFSPQEAEENWEKHTCQAVAPSKVKWKCKQCDFTTEHITQSGNIRRHGFKTKRVNKDGWRFEGKTVKRSCPGSGFAPIRIEPVGGN